MNGIRQANLSARKDETRAEMAPQAYGGAVRSWAFVDVKPIFLRIWGIVLKYRLVGWMGCEWGIDLQFQAVKRDYVGCKDHCLEVYLPIFCDLF